MSSLARAPSDPVKPLEAIAWFFAKVPALKEVWEAMAPEARARAFTVAWVTSLQVLQSLKDALGRAVRDGTPFRDFQRDVVKLKDEWSTSGPHLETIFRNNLQSAYAAGRYQAQTSPAVLKARPYWRLVVLLDSATSPYCRPLASPPVVLPADHPWWRSNFPPRHHRCRASTVTLTATQARRYGILIAAPKIVAQDGWGSTEGLGAWQPDPANYDRALFKAAQRGAKATAEP